MPPAELYSGNIDESSLQVLLSSFDDELPSSPAESDSGGIDESSLQDLIITITVI